MVKPYELHRAFTSAPQLLPSGPVAVIDIGASALRLAVAQIRAENSIETLEALQQPVSLGKDVFTQGFIGAETMAACASGLRRFCRILQEYQIPPDSERVRVVATSAVQEASNRQTFLDRVFIATGLDIEAMDNAEVTRFTYLSIEPHLDREPFGRDHTTLITEVGGGGTEVLGLRDGIVTTASAYKLGSLRLRQYMDDDGSDVPIQRQVLEGQMDRVFQQLADDLGAGVPPRLVAMGGDMRLAAMQLKPNWDRREMALLPLKHLARFADKVLHLSVEEVVQTYHITYPEAETLAPALLVLVRLAEFLELGEIYVTDLSMRDGVLTEMLSRNTWTSRFTEQIIHSAVALGKKYRFDESHGRQVAAIGRRLFHQLQDEHGLPPRYELLLIIAGLLHEVGLFVSNRKHHKHSLYLIQNSDVFGLGHRDMRLVARVARYHRRAIPSPRHQEFSELEREERIVVLKLAAILRVADALDRGHRQKVSRLACEVVRDTLCLSAEGVTDLTLEHLALQEKSDLFRDVYGLQVSLRDATVARDY